MFQFDPLACGRLALCALLLTVQAAAFASDVPDVVNRASIQSARATMSTILGISRAGSRLVAAGERGIVLVSDNEGRDWRQVVVPVSVTLTSVFFASEKEGWIVGHSGIVLHSTDAGETWKKQLDGIQAAKRVADLARNDAVRFAGDLARAEIVANAERFVKDGADKPFLDIHFSDERNGIIVGAYGLAFATRDGGQSWLPINNRIPNPKEKHLYRIINDGSNLWIAGEQGALFRSSDDGESFVEVKTPYAGTFFGAVAADNCNLLVFGLRGNALFTDDCGKRWSKLENRMEASLTAGIRLKSGVMMLVDQAGRLLESRDNGRTLTPLEKNFHYPLTNILEVGEGGLVLTGIAGVTRHVPASAKGKNR